jgi:hypothetical protein
MTRRCVLILVASVLIGCLSPAGPPQVPPDSDNTPATLNQRDPAAAVEYERARENPRGCPVIRFRGTVEDISIARAKGPGVLTLDFDSNWLIRIKVHSAAPENAFIKPETTAYFNVHSPVRTLGRDRAEAVGKVADFELIVEEKESDTVWSRVHLWVPPRVVNGRFRSGWEDE